MKKMIENQSKISREKTASKRKMGKRGGRRQNEREKRRLLRKIQNRISLLLDPSYHNQLLHSECSDRNLPCASFMKGYCKKNSSCTFHHDEEARSMKWEEEKKVEKKAKNHINDVNFTSFNLSTSFNQAKNAKSYSQGSQVAGGQTARSLGHPRGGHAGTGVNYGPRPGSASSNPGSSGQQTATSQAPAEGHQLFTQPPPAVIQPFSRQVSTPGPYAGPGPIYPHPQTPVVNIGNIDARGPGQGIPPSSAGWNSVSVASLECHADCRQLPGDVQDPKAGVHPQWACQLSEPHHRRQVPAGRRDRSRQGLREGGRPQTPAQHFVRRAAIINSQY